MYRFADLRTEPNRGPNRTEDRTETKTEEKNRTVDVFIFNQITLSFSSKRGSQNVNLDRSLRIFILPSIA